MAKKLRISAGRNSAAEISKSIRKRMKLLLLSSAIVVALAFGLTLYFALIFSESAISRHVPELEEVVTRAKGLLLTNTVVFVAVIIASFYALTSIVTLKIFHPIGMMQIDLESIASGKMPPDEGAADDGPFMGTYEVFAAAAEMLRQKENRELADLKSCSDLLSSSRDIPAALKKIHETINGKEAFLGIDRTEGSENKGGEEKDPLFIQPV